MTREAWAAGPFPMTCSKPPATRPHRIPAGQPTTGVGAPRSRGSSPDSTRGPRQTPSALPGPDQRRTLDSPPAAALNLRRLINLGLGHRNGTWTLTPAAP